LRLKIFNFRPGIQISIKESNFFMISHHLPLFALPRTRHLTVTFLYSYSHQEHLWHLPIASFFLYLVNDVWQGQCASYKKVIGVRHVAEVSGTHWGISGARQVADSNKN
jgi:hypothetical protein